MSMQGAVWQPTERSPPAPVDRNAWSLARIFESALADLMISEPEVISFPDALAETREVKRNLLLGNGFSIAAFPSTFSYASLLKEANFSDTPEAVQVFEALNTTDFEIVVRTLRDCEKILTVYTQEQKTLSRIKTLEHALKEILVQTISRKHPARPSAVSEPAYSACRTFLAHFVGERRGPKLGGRIYSLNYDLLLYWSLLHDEILVFDDDAPLETMYVPETETLAKTDGFGTPKDNMSAPYVVWDAMDKANQQTVHYLHGAIHLFESGPVLQKKCWERSGQSALVDQIRIELANGKFPLFVSEGESAEKLARISRSGYLLRSLKSFHEICKSESALFVFGHSMSRQDRHITSHIDDGKIRRVYVSYHGELKAPGNAQLVSWAAAAMAKRSARFPLEVKFFPADEANVWGQVSLRNAARPPATPGSRQQHVA